MMSGFLLFLRRCARMMIAPGQEVEQIVLGRARLGGWVLAWLATAVTTLWVGEALRPAWNSTAGYLSIALLAAAAGLLIQSLALHVAARLLGGPGSWSTTIAIGGYSVVPLIALVLIVGGGMAAYVRLFGPVPFHLATLLLLLLALLVVIITGLVIMRHGLSANYGLTARRAWAVTAAGVLVFSLGGTALRKGSLEKCAITSANLAAMSQIPSPFAAAGGDGARRLSIEYNANLRYYRKIPIRRGDIVLFHGPDGHGWMGRILGLPGEQAGLQDGQLIVEGVLQPEPWRKAGALTIPPQKLGPDEYFLWTDDRTPNLELAVESQFPRTIRRDQILGPTLRLPAVLLHWAFGPSSTSRSSHFN